MFFLIFVLSGCVKTKDISPGLELRQKMSKGSFSFRAHILADYEDRIYEFTTDCIWMPDEGLTFTLVAPETISGIHGNVSQTGGKILFDDQILLFDGLSQGNITPAIGPWLMMKAITGGYVRSVCENPVVISYDDSFQGEVLDLELTLNENNLPENCDIYLNSRRILSIRIEVVKEV